MLKIRQYYYMTFLTTAIKLFSYIFITFFTIVFFNCSLSTRMSCSVVSCKSQKKKKEAGISFHKFPAQDDLKLAWLNAINRPNWSPGCSNFICSKHFNEKDFEMSTMRKNLRSGVIPMTTTDQPTVQFEKNIPEKLKQLNTVPSTFVHHAETNHSEPPRKRQLTDSDRTRNTIVTYVINTAPSDGPTLQNSASKDNLVTRNVLGSLSTNTALQSCLSSTSEENDILRRKIESLTKTIQELKKERNELESRYSSLFNADQINFLKHPSEKTTWSEETIEKALELRMACGDTGYNMLISRGFPLPSDRTLRRKLQLITSDDEIKSEFKDN